MTRNTEFNIYHVRPGKKNIPVIANSVYSHVRGKTMTTDERSDTVKHA